MYSTIPIHWNIKSSPASPGRSRVGPVLYVFSLLVATDGTTGSVCCFNKIFLLFLISFEQKIVFSFSRQAKKRNFKQFRENFRESFQVTVMKKHELEQ
jgi:hypothetical protein